MEYLKPIVLSVPRSGLHLLRSATEYLHKKQTSAWNSLYLHHVHELDKTCVNCGQGYAGHDAYIFLLRDCYELLGKFYTVEDMRFFSGDPNFKVTKEYRDSGVNSTAKMLSSLIIYYDSLKGDNYFIRYEDMLNKTDETFKGVCKFLEIDFTPDCDLLNIGQDYFSKTKTNITMTPKGEINHYASLLSEEQRQTIKGVILRHLDITLYNKYLSYYEKE